MSERYAVWQGKRTREPGMPVRLVKPDGTALHVIREDLLSPSVRTDAELFPLDEAVRKALSQAEFDLTT